MTDTARTADGQSLVDYDYWLNTWPTEPVALTRANAADGYPRPLTPLSQDLVLTFEEAGVRRFYFETMGALGPGDCPRPFMQAYYGLIYLNADQMGDLGAALPGSTRRGMFQSILSLEPDPAYVTPPIPATEKVRMAVKGAQIAPRMIRMMRGITARIDSQIADIGRRRPADPDRITLAEAAAWLDRLEEISIACWETLGMGVALAIAVFEGTGKAVAKAIGEDGTDLTNRLHVGLGGNESAEAGKAIGHLAAAAHAEDGVAAALRGDTALADVRARGPRFSAVLDDVLERFGHRAPAELELARPSWRADPTQLLDVLRVELHRDAASANQPEAAAAIRTEADDELRRRSSLVLRPIVAALLRRSRTLMPVRENCKIPIVRLFDDTRRLVAGVGPLLVAAGVLPDAAAAHYLRYEELKAVLAGEPGPGCDELVRRRDAHARCLELDLPELVLADSTGVHPLDDDFVAGRGLLPPATISSVTRHLDGIGASPGRVTGTARVMLDPTEDFEPGDVLFAKSVDPGWSPILACAGAIVLDSGGLVCHGAVVARELGIPCVVGVRAGTVLARSGLGATVDGSAGTVDL